MKGLALGLVCLTMSGCGWFQSASVQAALKNAEVSVCNQETAALTSISQSIAKTLTCSNVAQIQTDLTAVLGNVNVCKWLPAPSTGLKLTGPIANLFCPIASSAAVGFLTQSIPSKWGCTATAEASAMQAALTSICETIPL